MFRRNILIIASTPFNQDHRSGTAIAVVSQTTSSSAWRDQPAPVGLVTIKHYEKSA